MSEEEVTKEQIESLAEKLDVFMASLPDRERDIMAQALANANDDETSGFCQHRMGTFPSYTGFALAVLIGPGVLIPIGFGQRYPLPNGEPVSVYKE